MEANAHDHPESPVVRNLNLVVDIGIGSCLFVAPLALAGRFPGGRLLLTVLVAITTFSWFLVRTLSRREQINWFWSGAEWICGAAVLLVALQILPVPTGVRDFFAPETASLLPLHTQADGGSNWSEWNRISLAPRATRIGLSMLLTYVMLFFVVVQRVRRRRDVERLLKAVALAGIAMAVLGLTQRLFGNGKFLWFLEHPSRDTLVAVKGTFVNENHFGHFLALCLGPLLWWIVKETADTEGPAKKNAFSFGSTANEQASRLVLLLWMGLGIVLVAGLMSFSRGGLAAMGLAGACSVGLFAFQGRIGKTAIVSAALVASVVGIAVWIHGQDILSRELSTLNSMSIDSLDADHGRRKIWNAVRLAAPNFAMLGSGVGSHQHIYPTYFSEKSSVHYTHAESGFLQILLETGGPGLALLLVGIGMSGYWIVSALFRTERDDIACLAVPLAAAWAVSVIHGVVDFNWYIPANMTVTLIVLALGARAWQLSGDQRMREKIDRVAWGSLTVAVAVMATFSVSQLIPPAKASASWSEYQAWSFATNRFQAKSIGNGRQRSLGFVDGSLPDTTNRMIELLDETLRDDPNDGVAHIRMAAMCLRQFEIMQAKSENAMALAQIRDAALTSGFESHQAMSDWVSRVVGENRVYLDRVLWHSQRGLSLNPTEGTGYLYLGEVAFLDESLVGSEHDLLKQAYAVRPYNAGIQFVYGRHKLLAGDSQTALALWKDAFRRGSSVRKRIIAAVGFEAPPQEIVQIFQPGLEGLSDMFDYYLRNQLGAQLQVIGTQYAAELEDQARLLSGETAGGLWFRAQFVHATLGDTEASAIAAQKSVEAEPTKYDNRFVCAIRMRDSGRYEEAIEQFRWCHRRQPENNDLPKVIQRLQQELRRPEKTARGRTPEIQR